MSYILEALRKADQERSAGSVPDLEAVHETSSPTSGSSRWVWALGVILAVNALVFAVLLYDRRDEPAPVAEVSPPPEKKAVREPPPPPPAVVLSRPAPRAPPPAVTANKPAPVAAPAQKPVPKPAAAPVAPSPVASAPPVAATPVPKVQPAASSQPAAVPAEKESGVPFLEDMSLEFRGSFDMPRLDVHVYDSDPQRRFLLIELKKYREGDTLASGAVIEEILPEGVRMFYRGTRFIYRK